MEVADRYDEYHSGVGLEQSEIGEVLVNRSESMDGSPRRTSGGKAVMCGFGLTIAGPQPPWPLPRPTPVLPWPPARK